MVDSISGFLTGVSNLMLFGVECLILAFIIPQGYKSLDIWLERRYPKYDCKAKCSGYCLLIVGEWGSGKTTLYEDVFKNKKQALQRFWLE